MNQVHWRDNRRHQHTSAIAAPARGTSTPAAGRARGLQLFLGCCDRQELLGDTGLHTNHGCLQLLSQPDEPTAVQRPSVFCNSGHVPRAALSTVSQARRSRSRRRSGKGKAAAGSSRLPLSSLHWPGLPQAHGPLQGGRWAHTPAGGAGRGAAKLAEGGHGLGRSKATASGGTTTPSSNSCNSGF